MSEETGLAVMPDAGALMRQATDVAGVCGQIVKTTAQEIQGRRYVRVEGWQAIATAHGCMLGARDVERIEGGVRAIGEVRRMADGALLSTAEGFVGDDEPTWSKRTEHARRAMAQTRAMSRVGRTAFAHVVVLIDGGLSTTPAEEVPAEGFGDRESHACPECGKELRQSKQVSGEWYCWAKKGGCGWAGPLTIEGEIVGEDDIPSELVEPPEIDALRKHLSKAKTQADLNKLATVHEKLKLDPHWINAGLILIDERAAALGISAEPKLGVLT